MGPPHIRGAPTLSRRRPYTFSNALYHTMYIYILHSQKLGRFYIGQTALPPEQRLEEHNSERNQNSFSTRGIPWALFLAIPCIDRAIQARILSCWPRQRASGRQHARHRAKSRLTSAMHGCLIVDRERLSGKEQPISYRLLNDLDHPPLLLFKIVGISPLNIGLC